MRQTPIVADPTLRAGQRRRYKRYRVAVPPLIGVQRPSYARAHGVRTTSTPPAGTRQTERPSTILPQRAVGTYKAPAGKRPRANAHPSKRQTTASAATCGQSMQGKQSHDWHQWCRGANQDATNSHGSSPWTANRGAIVPIDNVSTMQGRRTPTGVSMARRARLPRPIAGTRGCHPPLSRWIITTPSFPSSERPHVAPRASAMEWAPP